MSILQTRLLVVLVSCTILPRPVAADQPTSQAQQIDRYFVGLEDFGFSGAVLYAPKEGTPFTGFYGNSDSQNMVPVSEHTLFYVGSLAKQFTAAAILLLEAEGALSVEDPISKLLPNVPADKKSITIHQLLTHTSGLLRGHSDTTTELSRDEFLSWIMSTDLTFEPGEGWRYSNVGYCMLAAIIGERSQKSYSQFMHDQFFGPLGMEHTFVLGDSKLPEQEVARGSGPQATKWGVQPDPRDWPQTFLRKGPGGILTTVTDLLRWETALRSGKLLPENQLQKLFTPVRNSHAYGWFVVPTQSNGMLAVHDGAYPGFTADYRRYLDKGHTLVLVSNQDNLAKAISRRVANLLATGEIKMPPRATLLSGRYQLDQENAFLISADYAGLRIAPEGPLSYALLAFPEVTPLPNETRTRLTARSLTIIDALLTVDEGDFGSRLEGMDMADDAIKQAKSVRGDLLEVSQTWTSHRTVVAYDDPSDELKHVFIELKARTKTKYVECVWSDAKLQTVRTARLPTAESVLRPTMDGWWSYDLVSERSMHVQFKRDAQAGGLLVLELSHGDYTAVRETAAKN